MQRRLPLLTQQLRAHKFVSKRNKCPAEWPLHIKEEYVAKCSLEEADMRIMSADDFDVNLKILWKYHYAEFNDARTVSQGHSPVEVSKSLSRRDKLRIIRSGLARRATADDQPLGGGMRMYPVGETPKRRRRLIRHTVAINSARDIPEEQRVRLPQRDELFNTVFTKGATCIDIAAYYDSLRLPTAAHGAYGFLMDGVQYVLRTVPTGQRHSVALAQTLSLFIARNIPHVDVWIDNFRIAQPHERTRAEHEQNVRTIYRRAAALGLCFNESVENAVHALTRYEFCGIVYDHDNHEVRLSDKTRGKLTEIIEELSSEFHNVSTERALQMFGVLLYGQDVLHDRIERSALYYIFKNIRKLSRRLQAGDVRHHAAFWDSNKAHLLRWAANLADDGARRKIIAVDAAAPYIIYTDASMSGWGATVMPPSGVPRGFAGAWPKWLTDTEPQIAELEAAAVVNTLLYLKAPPHTVITMLVDNTTIVAGMNSGILANFRQSEALVMIADILRDKQWHIKSAENPADWLSRVDWDLMNCQ